MAELNDLYIHNLPKGAPPRGTPARSHHTARTYTAGFVTVTSVFLLILFIRLSLTGMTRSPGNESGLSSTAGMTCTPENGSVSSVAASSSPCPDPWILLTNKCYYFSDNRKSQRESKEDCETRNSRLATVTGGMILRLVTITAQEFWIGLASLGTHHNNGVWSGLWSDGSVVNLTKGSGSCAKIGHDLRLSNCHQALHWICERDVLTT